MICEKNHHERLKLAIQIRLTTFFYVSFVQILNVNNSDNEIVYRLSKNDHGALKVIFDVFFSSLMRKAYSLTRDKEASEEIVQNVLISVWNNRAKLKIEVSLKSYLFRAVKNQCYTFLKKRYKEEHEDIDLHASYLPSEQETDNHLRTDDLTVLLEKSIALLPDKTRIVFFLSRKDEMTYQEIATHLSISLKTVEYHMTKALKFIKEILEKSGYSLLLVMVFQ